MPKIRSIKPEFFLDFDISRNDMKCRLAFIGLWCYADREGRLEDCPERLKAEILPYDKIDMDAILKSLHPRFIIRYAVNGKKYIQIRNFLKHQRPHPHEPKSQIVACNDKKLLAMSCNVNDMTGTLDKDEVDTYGTDTDDLSAGKPRIVNKSVDKSKTDPFHIFMDWFLNEHEGLNPGNQDPKEQQAVAAGYARFGKAGRDVLAFARGDPEKAKAGTKEISRWLESENLEWKLDTIAQWMADWMDGNFKKAKIPSGNLPRLP